eukprot:s989_g4.t1
MPGPQLERGQSVEQELRCFVAFVCPVLVSPRGHVFLETEQPWYSLFSSDKSPRASDLSARLQPELRDPGAEDRSFGAAPTAPARDFRAMTTAHRPTWNAAIASNSNPGGNMMVAQTTKINNRDAATFKKMKFRQAGQGLLEDRGSRADLTEDLERREKAAKDEREGRIKERKRPSLEDNPFPEDADEELPSEDEKEKEAENEDDDDDDDDDDAEELMRELAKIKKEREEEEEAKKALQAKQDKRAQRDEVMKGNPLLAEGSDVSLKRRWDDDTVFKNQARTAPKVKQRYINDAVRSDFHKKFLSKYVWVDGVAH